MKRRKRKRDARRTDLLTLQSIGERCPRRTCRRVREDWTTIRSFDPTLENFADRFCRLISPRRSTQMEVDVGEWPNTNGWWDPRRNEVRPVRRCSTLLSYRDVRTLWWSVPLNLYSFDLRCPRPVNRRTSNGWRMDVAWSSSRNRLTHQGNKLMHVLSLLRHVSGLMDHWIYHRELNGDEKVE